MRDRRFFNNLPEYLRTEKNDRDSRVGEDILYEPENAEFASGYIGDTSIITAEDIKRVPPFPEANDLYRAQQLNVGATRIDSITSERRAAAFPDDLVRHLEVNGAITDDQNRLFGTPFYAWTPPIDPDKFTNFQKYFWIASGNATANGEYIVREPQGSRTVIHRFTGTGFTRFVVKLGRDAALDGEYFEDIDNANRFIYIKGAPDIRVRFSVVPDVPVDFTDLEIGDHVYVSRVGPEFQNPVMWRPSVDAGRWISNHVVVSMTYPESPRIGMIWEDTRVTPYRKFKMFDGVNWLDVDWEPGVPSGAVVGAKHRYDSRDIDSITDGWSRDNWWRHFEDLNGSDRALLVPGDQAIRPILEFWSGIETDGASKTARNQEINFPTYGIDPADRVIKKLSPGVYPGVTSDVTSTITAYMQDETRGDDVVLGFPLRYNDSGEFLFDITLETNPITIAGQPLLGYRYFRDGHTGTIHSIWSKADFASQQTNTNGVWSEPIGATSNPDHVLTKTFSRSDVVGHFSSVISGQPNASGSAVGINQYRWSGKSPVRGATMVDPEKTLLKTLGTMMVSELDFPGVVRFTAREFDRFFVRFERRMDELFDNGFLCDPTGTVRVPVADALDHILTDLFLDKNDQYPYWYTDMGTFRHVAVENTIVTVLDPDPKPIMAPASSARTGTSQTYTPMRFFDNGVEYLRGHDGTIRKAWGDDRDLIWLALEQRFYERVPNYYRDETSTFSARLSNSNFYLADYYGEWTPNVTSPPVDMVVQNTVGLTTLPPGTRVFSRDEITFASWSGESWYYVSAEIDETFLNRQDGMFYCYNGFTLTPVRTFNRGVQKDYTLNETLTILRRDFEYWTSVRTLDYVTNDIYDASNRFTWNYSSAGVEGNYRGIYRRLYNTYRPHQFPWEIVGYSSEPTWWRTRFVPTSVAPDGTPRYGAAHPMWSALQSGALGPTGALVRADLAMQAPVPVDATGELLDPIAAGVVDEDALVPDRLSDDWKYGDLGPVEQQWWESRGMSFAIALAGFLMKPGIWVDTFWSQLYIDVGVGQVHNGPHVVHSLTRTRPAINDLNFHLEVSSTGQTLTRPGIQTWISEMLRARSTDVQRAFIDVLKETKPALIWRTHGFVNTARTVIQKLDGKRIPFEDQHCLIHTTKPVRQDFCSGIMVSRDGTGYRVHGYDMLEPYFRYEVPNRGKFAGLTELRETFTATAQQYSFTMTTFDLPSPIDRGDSASFAVILNGVRLRDEFVTLVDTRNFTISSLLPIQEGDIVVVTRMTATSNPSTRVKTFKINGVMFGYASEGTGVFRDISYGSRLESSEDVMDLMIGYQRYLTSRGWKFDPEDTDDPNRVVDWVEGVKRFAAWVLDTSVAANNGEETPDFFFSPIARKAAFSSSFGWSLNVEAVQAGSYGVVDSRMTPIHPRDILTTRLGSEITLSAQEKANDIFGCRLMGVESQHAIVLSDVTRFNDLLFDPVLAIRAKSLRADTYRTLGWNGRIEAMGFVVSKDTVLPNFEKQTFDITRYYDTYNPPDDPVKRDSARDLLGWYDNQRYMDPISADDRTRFDHHRGILNSKGTMRAYKAFAVGTRMGHERVGFHEDWAWRLQDFGDTRREIVEFNVSMADFQTDIQAIAFNSEDIPYDYILQIPPFERSSSAINERWVLPPERDTNGTENFTFPVVDGVVRTRDVQYSAKLIDRNKSATMAELFHYDPLLARFDPKALTQIDHWGPSDPARYTEGNAASYSDKKAWGQEQVGSIWWDTTRLDHTRYDDFVRSPENGAWEIMEERDTDAALVYNFPIPEPQSNSYRVRFLIWNGTEYLPIDESGLQYTRLDTPTVVTLTFASAPPNGTKIKVEELQGLYFDTPDIKSASREWGKLKYFRCNATVDADGYLNLVTVDPYTLKVVPHGFTVNGHEVLLSGMTPQEINGLYSIEVVNETTIRFLINAGSTIQLTASQPQIQVGFVDVYEWVQSTVTPQQYLKVPDLVRNNGLPYGGTRCPYVARVIPTPSGGTVTLYFFWVRSRANFNPRKELTTNTIRQRLTNPTLSGLPWFAPVAEDQMLLGLKPEIVRDDFSIQLKIDQRKYATHTEWAVFPVSGGFHTIPTQVWGKILDSIAQSDDRGNVVPSPKLSIEERFGTSSFPQQTIFLDPVAARDVFLASINDLFARKNLGREIMLRGKIDVTAQGTWWVPATYSIEGVKTPTDTISTIAERDRRTAKTMYVAGDVVRVIASNELNPWQTATVPAWYRLTKTGWELVGIEQGTIAITQTLFSLSNLTKRTIIDEIYDAMDREDRQTLVYAMLHEMLRQHPTCDWFVKTSYTDGYILDRISDAPYVRPDHPEAAIEQFLDTKPFRTKLRQMVIAEEVSEPAPIAIEERPLTKVTVAPDWVNHEASEDFGLDGCGLDEYPHDLAIPFMEDLGRDEWGCVEEYDLFSTDGAFTGKKWDGTTGDDTFALGLPLNDLVKMNVFLYVGDQFKRQDEFEISNAGEIVLDTPLAMDQPVVAWIFRSGFGNTTPVWGETSYAFDGVSTYDVGFGATQTTTFVYVGGVLQVPGVHYRITTAGRIQYLIAIAPLTPITIRYVKRSLFTVQNSVYETALTSGFNGHVFNVPFEFETHEATLFLDGRLIDLYGPTPEASLGFRLGQVVVNWNEQTPGMNRRITLMVVKNVNYGTVMTPHSYTTILPHETFVYPIRARIWNGTEYIALEDSGLPFTRSDDDFDEITVSFPMSAPSGYRLRIEQIRGVYGDVPELLNQDYRNSSMRAAEPTWFHNTFRYMRNGLVPINTNTLPPERVETEMTDGAVLTVQQFWTDAYEGLDAGPLDILGIDEGVTDTGPLAFSLLARDQNVIPAGSTVGLPTSHTFVADSNRLITRGLESTIWDNFGHELYSVTINGEEWFEPTYTVERTEPFNVVRFDATSVAVSYVTDGVTTVYPIGFPATYFDRIVLNGFPLIEGTNYNIVGDNIEFVQPPTPIPNDGDHYGKRTDLAIGQQSIDAGIPLAEAVAANIMVFRAKRLLPLSDYTSTAVANVILNTPNAVANQQYITWGFRTNTGFPAEIWGEFRTTSDGYTTSFTVGNQANYSTCIVFVDGRARLPDVHYTHPVYGQIEFTSVPTIGSTIVIRYLKQDLYTPTEVFYLRTATNGGFSPNTITVPFTFDKTELLLLREGEPVDLYSSTPQATISFAGNVMTLSWNMLNPADASLVLRVIRGINTVDENISYTYPPANSTIDIYRTSFVQPGDLIEMRYRGWDVGPVRNYHVISADADLMVDRERLRLVDPPVPNETITIRYNVDRLLQHEIVTYAKMAHVVDVVETLDDLETPNHAGQWWSTARVLNLSDDQFYRFDGSNWVIDTSPGAETVALDLTDRTVWENPGTNWTQIGDKSDRIITVPAGETGVTSHTYVLAQYSQVQTEYEWVHRISQYPGAP